MILDPPMISGWFIQNTKIGSKTEFDKLCIYPISNRYN